jgi:hypothetical protein
MAWPTSVVLSKLVSSIIWVPSDQVGQPEDGRGRGGSSLDEAQPTDRPEDKRPAAFTLSEVAERPAVGEVVDQIVNPAQEAHTRGPAA